MERLSEIRRRLCAETEPGHVIDELEREAEGGGGADRSDTLFQLGIACEEIVPDKERALALYQRAWKLHPENIQALARARAIYRDLGKLELVAKLFELEVKVVKDKGPRAAALLGLGTTLLDLHQGEAALQHLAEGAGIEAGNPDFEAALAVARATAETWQQASDKALSAARRQSGTTAARQFLLAARVLAMFAPDDPMREQSLRRAIAAAPDSEDAFYLLEGLLHGTGRAAEVVELQEQRASALAGPARADAYRRMATIWTHRFGDRERGAELARKALELAYANGEAPLPGHLATVAFLRDALGAKGEWGPFVELAGRGLKAKVTAEEKIFLARAGALAAWKQLSDVERARAFFTELRELDPNSAELKEFLASTGGGGASDGAAVVAAVKEVKEKEPTGKVSRGRKNKASPEAKAEAKPGAKSDARPEAQSEAKAGGGLEAAALGEGADAQAADVAAVPSEAVPVVEPPAQRAPVPAAGEEAAETLDAATQKLVDAARQVEAGGEKGPEKAPDKAIDAWRKAVQSAPDKLTPRRELARVLRQAEKWQPLAEALKEIAEKTHSPQEKVTALSEAAQLYKEKLKLDVMLLNTLNAIVAVDPDNHAALDALAAQYEAMKRWPDLISTLQKKAARTADAKDKAALHLRVGGLYQEKFSNTAEAIKAYEAAIDLDPGNDSALEFLKQNYEKRRDWEKLIGVKRREVERASGAERTARMVEIAKLASEKLKKASLSIELWEKVLESEPDQLEALSELEKLYEREKKWEELAKVDERLVELTKDRAARAAALGKLGVLYGEKLSSPDRASAAWKALLEIEPENRRAQDAIKKLYLQQKAWDDLEAFYAAQNKIDEYVRVLERQAETEDDKTKIDLHGRIAVLYRDKLNKADRAMRAFERVLSLDARNQAAAEALVPLYEHAKDNRKLAQALEIQLGHTEDKGLRMERMRRLVELSEKALKDKGAAFGWSLKLFAEDPSAEPARLDAERLAKETGGFAELVAAYEKATAEFTDPVAALPLHQTIARVYETELADIDKATAANARILELDENAREAVLALERLYSRASRWDDLLKVLERKLTLAVESGDAETDRSVRYRIAALYEEELKQPETAIARYKDALERFGDQAEGLQALDRLHGAAGAHRELEDVLLRQIALAQSNATPDVKAQCELKMRLGQLREGALGDVAGAIDCYREILDLDGAHKGAREALEKRLQERDHQLACAAILEPIYTKLEEWRPLIEVHEIQLLRRDEADLAGRVELLLRIAELWAGKAGDGDKAFQAYSRCFRADPAVEHARIELVRLADVLDKSAELVQLFESAVAKDSSLEPRLQRELCLKIAQLYDEKLEKPEPAIEYYRRAQVLDPEEPTALESLEKLFQRKEQWAELIEVYRKKIELTRDREVRTKLFFQAASIWEEMLQNAAEAIATYQELLTEEDTNIQALRALDRLYASEQRWRELADNLSRQLTLVSDDRAAEVALQVRLAELRETRLSEVGAAIETYRRVLELEPANAAARTALERLVQQPDHESVVAQVLEPIYKASGDWQRLIAVYEILARHALDPAQKISLLHQIGQLYEEVGDSPEQAFALYDRALREDPSLTETQGRLHRLAGTLGKWEDLVKLYEQVAAQAMDEDLKASLQMKVAHVLQDQVQDFARAAEAFEKVFTVDAKNLEAADALLRLYEAEGIFPRLVDVLLRKADIVSDVEERKRLCFQAAELREGRVGDAQGAIDVYRHILELDENDLQALDNLERLYIQLSSWDNLKDVYAKKAALAQSPEEKKKMLFVLGQVYDAELGDKPKAIETYQGILDLDPEDYEAIQALDRLFAQTQRWYDLLQILEREVELAQATGDIVSLKFRMGQLWEAELKDLTRAVEAYKEALALDASHEPSLKALDGIAHREGDPVAAAQVLEPIYNQACEWDKLVDLYEVMVRHAEDPLRRVELLHTIASIDERKLAQAEPAFLAYARALKEDPQSEPTLANLERLAGATGDWAALARLYEEELSRTVEPARQVDLLLRVARVYAEELKQPDQAIAAFRRVLDADAENRTAILALDRAYEGLERWRELSEILRREIRMATSDEEIVRLQFRLAQTFEQNLKDLPAAVEVYREILAATPGHSPTMAALELLFAEGVLPNDIADILEPLYRVAEQWEKLLRVYEVQLARVEEPGERFAMFQRMGEIAEKRLGDAMRAFSLWGRALGEDPNREAVVEELERIAGLVSAWSELVEVYRTVLAAHGGAAEADVQKQLLLRLGRVYEAELKDRALAEETFLRVLALDEKNELALAALDRVYTASGMWGDLAEILRRRIALTTATDDLLELQFRLGRVYTEALDDVDAAVKCYDTILETDSRSARALEALERIYFQRESWAKLFGVYEKLVDIAPGDEALADCYAHMARIAQDALGEDGKATDLWGRVLDLRGEDPIAFEALADIHERREQWRELVDVLERQARVIEDSAGKVAAHKRLGRIWADRLDRVRNALEAWGRALELDPGDMEALRAVAELHRKSQSWDEYGAALRRVIEVGVTQLSDDEVKELYAELGRLEAETLLRPQAAVDAWRKVLEVDPGDARALEALERIFSGEARWEECIEILERKAMLADDPRERIEVLLQAAKMWEEKVGDLGRASQAYERVLAAEPSNQVASLAVERVAREQQSWEKVIEVLLSRVEHLPDPESRIAALHNVARTYEQELGQPDLAFEVLRAAFKEDYANDETAAELQRIASSAGKWNELLGDYSQVVQTIQDKDIACDLWVKIANWYGDHLGHLPYAVASASQALSLDPNHPGALASLAQLHRKSQKWPELAGVLEHHAEVETDPVKKGAILLQLADVQQSQLGDVDRAVASYRAALALDSESMAALVALERIHRQLEQWGPLVDVLARKAELIKEPEEVIPLRLAIGDLYENELGDPARAVESYREVIRIDPRHLVALRALEQLYEKLGDSSSEVAVLEQQLEAVQSEDERVAILRHLGGMHEERFNRIDLACQAFEKILEARDRDEGAFESLERLYAMERKLDLLVGTLRRHIDAVADPTQRIGLHARMGNVYENEIRDIDRAIDSYQDILSLQPDHDGALYALGRLFEKREDWGRAVETMERHLQIADENRIRTELLHRIGVILDARQGEPESAEERYVQALTVDPAYVPAMGSLTEMYKKRGDWLKAANMMVRAEAHAETSIEKVRLLYEAGRIFLERIQDEVRAADLLARTIALDPEHQGAGEPLSEIYFKEQRWAELEPILDMLVRKADKRDGRELNLLYYRLARTADELGNVEKAIKYYKAAYDIDSTYLPTLLGRAALLYKESDWDGAFKIYQTILVHHRDSQKDADIVEIFYRLGNVKLKQNERKKALNMFEKALEIDPNHRPTLEAMIELQVQSGDLEAAIHAKRSLIASPSTSEEEKFKILDEIGDLYHENLQNPQKAIGAYGEALDLRPNDHVVLHKILELYTETKQWKKAVEVLLKVAELEKDPLRRGKYYYTAAVIDRDEAKAVDEAVEHFQLALDSYFEKPELLDEASVTNHLKAFEATDRILTQKKDWKTLERSYRRMIKRLPPEGYGSIKTALYHALGEIYRSRLRDWNAAMAAFEVASQLDPQNLARHEILAELYLVAGQEHWQKAVTEHQLLIKNSPYRIDSYRALRKIYMDLRQYDKAWCLCAALAFLKKADPEEQQFFEQYRPKGMVRAKARVTDELWNKAVFHPDQDRYIGAILGTIQQGIAIERSRPHKDFGLKRKDKHDLATSQVLFAKVFGYTVQVLGLPTPELYLRPEQPGEIAVAPTNEKGVFIPSIVAQANVLQGRPDRELAYICGRWLAMMRPEHFLKWIVPTNAELKMLFLVALRLVNPKVPVPGDAAMVQQFHERIVSAVPPQMLEALAAVVNKFFATKAEVDLSKWSGVVDLTAQRVGFILCGDLETAARLVSQEPVTVGGLQPKERIKEIILYSISEEYFMVRQALGLAIAA